MNEHKRAGRTGKILAVVLGPAVICVCLALWSALLVWHLDPVFQKNFKFALLWRNALPVALLALVFYAASGRRLTAFVLTTGLTLLVYRINAIKELNMNAPIMPGDVVLRHQVFNNIGFLAHYFHHRALWLTVVLLLMAGLVWAWRFERRWDLPGLRFRLVCFVLAAAGLCTLYRGDLFWRATYSTGEMAGFPLWHPAEGVHRVGLISGFVRMAHEAEVTVPAPDRPAVRQFAASHADGLRSRGKRPVPTELPDIVVVQSEAFFDPGVLKGVEYGQYTPNFERLADTGISGSLKTPAYGGGTIRTEFETLTGYPIDAFPSVAFPYYGLADRWMPTVPRRLEQMGYSATLFHPFKADFWNRAQVMPRLGFQQSFYEGDFKHAQHAGRYVSDKALFDFVLAHMRGDDAPPQYDMVITMENHGPWESDVGQFADILRDEPLPANVSDDGKRELRHYLSHLVNGDRALGGFAQQLMARHRWTVLLFYGDHLPSLPHAFDELGFDDANPGTSQSTRYLLISNRPFEHRTLDLHSYDLPGLVFDTLRLPETGYLAVSAEARHAWALDNYEHSEDYRHVEFETARMEMKCRHALTIDMECSGDGGAAAAAK